MTLKKMAGELFRGSFTLFIFMNLFNVLNYFFHFVSARLLGPADYGILAAIMSMIFVFSIPADTIQTILSRYSTKYNLENKKMLKDLLVKSMKKFTLAGLISTGIFLLFSPVISKFLFIDLRLIMLSGLILFSFFVIPIPRGILQGTKKFFSLGISIIIESSSKLIFVALLIMLGFGVAGALWGVLIGFGIAFIASLLLIRDVLKEKSDGGKIMGIYSYSLPVLISVIAITLFYSFDVIIAKRFFSNELVGQYAVVSLIGKTLFFGTVPISRAMFPLVSEKHDKNEKKDVSSILKKTMLLVFAIDIVALVIIMLFPKLIISILYGAGYGELSSYLGYIGLAMTFLSLTNVILFYNLSIHRYNTSFIVLIFALLQIIVLFMFSNSMLQFILAFLAINFITFIASVLSLKLKSKSSTLSV